MKTFLLAMLTLIAVVAVLAVVIVLGLKLVHHLSSDSELDHPWPAETPVEVRLNLDDSLNNWILQVRKKKNFRLLKDYGWKDVLLYYPWGDRPNWYYQNYGEYTWNKISWPVGINQFYEDRTLKSMIRTYGDLDGYYGLTQGYKEYMKQTFNEE